MGKQVVDTEKLEKIANRIRVKSIKMLGRTTGHIGGSMSIVEMLAVLYFHEMNIDPTNPDYEDRDRLVLSKGHGCPALYSTLIEVGFIPESALMTLHKMDSILQGHPDMTVCPGIDMSTGALGQGISAAAGMALAAKLKAKSLRVYTIVGDAETHEGQVWETAMFASKYKLDNLVAIVDFNKFALSETTEKVMPVEPAVDKWRSFGWHVIEIDGHSILQIIDALDEAKKTKAKPTAIIANTIKANKVSCWVGKWQCHSVTLTPEQVEQTLRDLGCPQEEIELTLSQIKEEK